MSGDMAGMALDDVIDMEEARADFRSGLMSDGVAYERGIIDELGFESTGRKIRNMATAKPAPTRIPGAYRPGEKTDKQNGLGICIYGQGGSGKTTLVGTMPGRGLVIDVPQVEGGTFVLSDHADRIDVVPVQDWKGIDEVFWFLKDKPHNYQWVAIDSITAFTELAKRKTVGERPIGSADKGMVTLQDWGKIGQLVGEMVYQFRTLPIHTIWIAQERGFGNEDTGEHRIGPNTSPAALTALIPSMMLIGHLSVEMNTAGGWERHLRIGPHPTFYTKYRATPDKDVPGVVRHPRLDTILKFILGSGARPEEVPEFNPVSFAEVGVEIAPVAPLEPIIPTG